MAKFVATNYALTVNSVDLSDHVQSMTVQMAAEDVDLTAMGATSREHGVGLRDDRITVTLFQDFASGEVDATLSGLISSAGFPVIAKPLATTVSSVNPSYTGTFILLGYDPLNATVGEAATTEVEFVPAAGSYITRATT
jgi:hypothetical protein